MGKYSIWSLALLCYTIVVFVEGYSNQDVIESIQNEYTKRSFDDYLNSNKVEGTGGANSLLSVGVPKHFGCERYPKPKNGMVRCGGTLCLVECDDGYIQDQAHAFVYQCSRNNKWLTIPKGKDIPWPNCVKMLPFEK